MVRRTEDGTKERCMPFGGTHRRCERDQRNGVEQGEQTRRTPALVHAKLRAEEMPQRFPNEDTRGAQFYKSPLLLITPSLPSPFFDACTGGCELQVQRKNRIQ